MDRISRVESAFSAGQLAGYVPAASAAATPGLDLSSWGPQMQHGAATMRSAISSWGPQMQR